MLEEANPTLIDIFLDNPNLLIRIGSAQPLKALPLGLSMITSLHFVTLFLPQFSHYEGPQLLLTGVGHFTHEDGDVVLLVDDDEDEGPVHCHVLLLPEVGAQ